VHDLKVRLPEDIRQQMFELDATLLRACALPTNGWSSNTAFTPFRF
jgi:hypothetical protein